MRGVIVGREAMNDVSAGPAGPLGGLRIFPQEPPPAVEGKQSRALTGSVIPIAHPAVP
jgi:hypothetical protein